MSQSHFLPFALPDITDAEIQAVSDVLRSGWVTTGPKTKEFEETFGKTIGAPHTIMLNSCTAALHLALESLGVGPGDEVLVPTITFASTANVVRHLGATPVLVDVRTHDHNIDPEAVERAMTPRTKVIIPVYFAGVPCDMDELSALAKKRDVKIVADSAHCFPGTYKGRNLGELADITCFSFYATKTITTGEGGAVATADEKLAQRMRIMSLHGISKDAWKRYTAEGSWYYEILAPGYKYNMTDTAAALGLVQLSRNNDMLQKRLAMAQRYRDAFVDWPIECLAPENDRTNAQHLFVIRLKKNALKIDRQLFIQELKSRQIGTSVHFIPLHIHPYYRDTYGYRPNDLPVAWDVYQRMVSLPLYSKMTDTDVERVIREIREICEKFLN